MPSYLARVRTPWTPKDAFAYMADLSNFDEWDPGTSRAVLVDGTPGHAGATYDLTVGGRTLRYNVTEVDDGSRVVAHAETSSLQSVDTITVTNDGEGSVVTYHADLEPKGWLRLLGPLLAARFRQMSEKGAKGLARKLDGQLLTAG